MGFPGRKQWRDYFSNNKNPKDIPLHPEIIYQKDWKGWGDWFGTGFVATFNRKYRSFEEARAFVRSLGIKNQKEWNEYCTSDKKPDDIPTNPWKVYSKKRKK